MVLKETIGLITFDNNSFLALKNLNKKSDLSFRILTISDFVKINIDFKEIGETGKVKSYINNKNLEYIYSQLEGIDKIFCITNNNINNERMSYRIKKYLKKINKNVEVLNITLNNITIDNLKESLKNTFPIKEEYFYRNVRLKSINILSGSILSRILTGHYGRKIKASRISIPFLSYLIKLQDEKKNKYEQKRTINTDIKEIISEKEKRKDYKLFEKKLTMLEHINDLLKISPDMKIKKLKEHINKFYWGIEIKKDFHNLTSYGLTNEEKIIIKNILEKYNIKYVNRDINQNQIFINNFKYLIKNKKSKLDRLIYKILLIKTFLYFSEFSVYNELLIYKNKHSRNYYKNDLPKEFCDFLAKEFEIEEWMIDLVLNDKLKVKKLIIRQKSLTLLEITKNQKELNELGINTFNIEYYLDHLKNNGFVKVFNNEVTLTSKRYEIYKVLQKDFKFLINNDINKQINININSIKDKETMYKFIKSFHNNLNKFVFLLDKPTLKQIKYLESFSDVPKEAFENKIEATKFIDSKIPDKIPSEKQIEYANKLADQLDVKDELTEDILNSSKKISQWIYLSRKKITIPATEKMIKYAKDLSDSYKAPLDEKIFNDFFKTRNYIQSLS